jgi:hypothetical protein
METSFMDGCARRVRGYSLPSRRLDIGFPATPARRVAAHGPFNLKMSATRPKTPVNRALTEKGGFLDQGCAGHPAARELKNGPAPSGGPLPMSL